ncbi:MAG TPA: ABC transporter permease [Pseudomonadales bacterium]
MLGQIAEITLMNLRNVGSRLGSSSVIVVGIGGVVAVLVALLALGTGFRSALERTGDPHRAVVLRGGSTGELSSGLTTEDRNIVASLPGVALASGELFLIADLPKRSNQSVANLVVRGVTPEAFRIRPELTIVEGRNFTPGRGEVIVGRGAAAEFEGLALGGRIELRDTTWTVVGMFEADGSANESEVWADLGAVQSAFRFDGVLTSMRLRVDDPAVIPQLARQVDDDPRLDLEVHPEVEYYRSQAETLSTLITVFGYAVAGVMAIGAVFAALNTMYTAVANRTVEIATLRAIGFGGLPVVTSVLAESLLLALAGGLLGAGLAYLVFNGMTVSTLNQASFSQVAFDFAVTPELMRLGLVWALGLGAVGGLFPAVRAARLPITAALRRG